MVISGSTLSLPPPFSVGAPRAAALAELKLSTDVVDEISELSFVQELNRQRHAKAILLRLIVFIWGPFTN
jgi:hypothetical protein